MMSETTGHSQLPTIQFVRREILDKLQVYAAASSSPIPIHRAVVEQQCIDYLADLYASLLHDRDTIRAALKEYGKHKVECDALTCEVCFRHTQNGYHVSSGPVHVFKARPCTCGWSSLLQSISESETP